MENKTTLQLKENYVEVQIEKNDMVTNKTLGYDSLTSLFTQEDSFDSALLPGEYGIQKMSKRRNSEFYMYLEPPREVTCKYSISGYNGDAEDHIDRDDYEDDDDYQEAIDEWNEMKDRDYQENKFITPSLLWMVELQKRPNGSYQFRRMKMYAMKSPIFTGSEPLYRAPFSNIYPDAKVCWNEVAVSIPQVKAIQGLSTLFFGGIGNRDLDEYRFERFSRSYVDGSAHLSLHFQMEVDAMLKDETKTKEEVLEFVESKLLRQDDMTVNGAFQSFIAGH